MKFMKLKIRNVGANDFGTYRCVAKNSLGETDGNIKLDGKSNTMLNRSNRNPFHLITDFLFPFQPYISFFMQMSTIEMSLGFECRVNVKKCRHQQLRWALKLPCRIARQPVSTTPLSFILEETILNSFAYPCSLNDFR